MTMPSDSARIPTLVCFSHLRWDFVYQRPQHLMSRFARSRRVLFVEEPVFELDADPHLRVTPRAGGLEVIVPVLPENTDARRAIAAQRSLLTAHLTRVAGRRPTFWFQTPMALPAAPTELAGVVIYDCMDELSAFHDAPPALLFNEKQLLARADLVFTGGRALYEAKRSKHPAVHCFPSSIDRAHFARARQLRQAQADAANSAVRVGFAGVVDERLDVDLLAAVTVLRPQMQFEIVGPVAKIDPGILPRRDNISYLGFRDYADLPELMAGWDVAIMPFARNAATEFISPTKTPEYLAAGLPVVSTSIRDVVRQYGDAGLVTIADGSGGFAAAIDAAALVRDDRSRLRAVDTALEGSSWDSIWERMSALERLVHLDVTGGATRVNEPAVDAAR